MLPANNQQSSTSTITAAATAVADTAAATAATSTITAAATAAADGTAKAAGLLRLTSFPGSSSNHNSNQPALQLYFAKYLASGQNRGDQDYNRKVSRASLKNYLSDIHLFLAWISRTLQQEEILAANITAPVMDNYRSHLLRRLSPAAAKRHLSSLRLFGRFLINTNRTNEDPAKNLYAPTDASGAVVAAEPVPTLSKITADFAGYLKHENLTNTTIKNYLSDVHRYLLWAKENLGLTDNNLDLRNTN